MGTNLLHKFYRCVPCKMEWDIVFVWGAGMQDEMYALPPGFENGAENCPQCGKHRASKNSEIHPFPEGCVVVWGEKEIA